VLSNDSSDKSSTRARQTAEQQVELAYAYSAQEMVNTGHQDIREYFLVHLTSAEQHGNQCQGGPDHQ
jgi:hypothetical protein